MKPKNIKHLQAQSRHMNTRRVDRHTLVVQSMSNPVANHIVTVDFGDEGMIQARCTCEWAVNRGIACTHVMAALEHLASMKNRTLSFWPTKEEAQRQKHRVFYLSGGEQNHDDEEGVWITSRTG